MKFVRISGVCIMLFLLLTNAEAKWWIFGQSESPVETRYLFINGISYDQSGPKITLYKDMLKDGMIVIRGRAASKDRKVGAVQVSIDGKEKWQRANLAQDGTLEFGFRPEIGSTYKIYLKIIDTAGKTNDVDRTLKEVTLSDRDILGIVRETLEKLVGAYRREDTAGFMALVSDDFLSGKASLDRAIRRDFNALDNINLRYTINNIASDAKGNILVSLAYTRSVISSKSGKSFSDRGTTELALKMGDHQPQLYSMKNPLLFGLSDPENVGAGTVSSGSGEQAIIIDGKGEVKVASVDDATGGKTGAGGGGGSSASGIPAPSKLTTSGQKHHFLDLSFDTTVTIESCPNCETVAEEATSPNGPWFEVARKPLDTFVRVMSQLIAQKAILLYYRVKIVKGPESSPPSSVVTWDNR
jgi:hypothetical protein